MCKTILEYRHNIVRKLTDRMSNCDDCSSSCELRVSKKNFQENGNPFPSRNQVENFCWPDRPLWERYS